MSEFKDGMLEAVRMLRTWADDEEAEGDELNGGNAREYRVLRRAADLIEERAKP